MAEKCAFLFFCDQGTEAECLVTQLVGSPQTNALWAVEIRFGDRIYLLNLNTRIIRGPYSAISSADCHNPVAWGGRFPIQVKVAKTDQTRVGDAQSKGAPPFLLRRLPSHLVLGSK